MPNKKINKIRIKKQIIIMVI